MQDTFKHQGLRRKLVEIIIEKGIKDEKVLSAIGKIPRHLFMDNAFIHFAYEDKAFPIGAEQTISQPYTVAFQTELLDIKPYEKILEIGTGSGYQAAILVALEASVFTIERQRELFQKTKDFLPKIGYKCQFYYGDGYKGLPKFAPFDKIIVTCGAPEIPIELINQLKIGGKLVAPIGSSDIQEMQLLEKVTEKENKVT
ncbi:MAG: protein-L-isoaspartate(D-aspartate) O-methyltransferase, partial [Bacteroidota bacterium]|nr:protein-L-isoaspartate(D-aspartate) O-methyltransferase [Bacteroidota bacterium]